MQKSNFIFLISVILLLTGCSSEPKDSPIERLEDRYSFEHLSSKVGIITTISDNYMEIDTQEDNEEYIIEYISSYHFSDEYKIGDKVKVYYFSTNGEVENNTIKIDRKESVVRYDE